MKRTRKECACGRSVDGTKEGVCADDRRWMIADGGLVFVDFWD